MYFEGCLENMKNLTNLDVPSVSPIMGLMQHNISVVFFILICKYKIKFPRVKTFILQINNIPDTFYFFNSVNLMNIHLKSQ